MATPSTLTIQPGDVPWAGPGGRAPNHLYIFHAGGFIDALTIVFARNPNITADELFEWMSLQIGIYFGPSNNPDIIYRKIGNAILKAHNQDCLILRRDTSNNGQVIFKINYSDFVPPNSIQPGVNELQPGRGGRSRRTRRTRRTRKH